SERKKLALASRGFEARQRVGVNLRSAIAEHVFGEKLARVRGWLRRKRLFGGCFFSGDSAGRIFLVFDWEKRLAGGAIEEDDETVLGSLRDSVDGFAIAMDADERGRGGKITVPNIVTNGLEVPDAFASFGVEREEGVGEQIVADAIAAVKVECGGACGCVDD